MNPSITVLQPDKTVPLERFTEWLQHAGLRLNTINLWEQRVPDLAEVGQGVIILGGRDNCLTGYAWMPQLHDLIHQLVEQNVPILGICLGHQILANALGGTVTLGLEGEEGAFPITLSSAGKHDPLFAGLPLTFMAAESHHDVVTALPPRATLLASSARYPNQAFRVGSAVGVQFHPEASPALMGRWASDEGSNPAPLIAEMVEHDAEIADAGRRIAERFAQRVQVAAYSFEHA